MALTVWENQIITELQRGAKPKLDRESLARANRHAGNFSRDTEAVKVDKE